MPTLPEYDPLVYPVDRTRINEVRDLLEAAPLKVNGTSVDIDERAEKRMRDALMNWEVLGVNELPWTMADNSIVMLTYEALNTLYTEALRLRTLRGFELHRQAQELKNNPETTERDLQNWRATIATLY